MRVFILVVFLSLTCAFALNAQTPTPQRTPEASAYKEEPPVASKRSIRAGARQLNYTVTTGFMPIRNDRTGEVEAKLFYMAYTLDGTTDPAKRPLMFSFNGGPGSASVWLHLGALGPRRVKMLDDGMMPPPPYELADNESTWLGETDIVFIDPVGTGYSRATKPEFASKFWGVNGDIDSMGECIRMYLGRAERWASPLFLVGESYGTTRAAGLSNYLFEHGVGLNGIILISTVMNFGTIRFAENNDLPIVLIFPSYTSTAWYHKKLPPEQQRRPLRDVLRDAEKFAANEYLPALLRIDRLMPQEKQSLLDKFSMFTGLNKDFIDRANFRIDLNEFLKELLRDQRRTVGRLDSRFTGIDRDASGNGTEFDPSMTAIRPPYTSAFNDYIRRELNYKSDTEYWILGGGVTGAWNWNIDNGYADTSQALSSAMRKNPYMKVLVAQGYYDMATPYFAAEYSVSAMNLDPQIKKNFTFEYYEAGHMMYIEKNSLKKLHDDAAAFVQNSLKK